MTATTADARERASGPAPSPPALRLERPSWRDARLVWGVLLVLGSVLLGARVLGTADRTTPVWQTTRALAAGTVLTEEDLALTDARLVRVGDSYLTGDSPVGYVLTRAVGAEELLPRQAVAPADQLRDRREVTVSVEAGRLGPDLGHGGVVDVYVTPTAEGRAEQVATPRLVLAAATVLTVDREGTLGARGADVTVVLSVAQQDVAALVAALAGGTVDLVTVPSAS